MDMSIQSRSSVAAQVRIIRGTLIRIAQNRPMCPSRIEEEFGIAIRCEAKEIVMFFLAVQVSYLKVAR